ncbi:MAG: type II toxin-antitoxin system RelE/ParE family toxin [Rhizobiales bacterium]|jgi:plasmid stabilization system protein ParE|nr:type II toxin-antitoxin system RelE/ParE family toxin [Hyphomicrobiales bacterium]
MRVRFTRRAARDLAEIGDYIAVEDPDAAARVRDAIVGAIDRVARHPHLGIKNVRAPDLRSCLAIPFPYRIHYRVRDGSISIVHVRHTSRREWNPR